GVAGDQPTDGRCRRGPEAPCDRDAVLHLDAPADALGHGAAGLDQRGLEATDEAVVAVVRQLALAFAQDGELDRTPAPAADLDLDPVVQVEREPEAVVAGAEVRRGRR